MYDFYNSEKIEKLIKMIHICISEILGMKTYLQVSLIIGIKGIYLKKELYIML